MLRLMETHPAAAVERAVAAALERHSPRLETVRLILRQQQAGPPPVCPPAHSGETDHPFRSKPITHSGPNRSPIPVQTDHPFRPKPITRSERGDAGPES